MSMYSSGGGIIIYIIMFLILSFSNCITTHANEIDYNEITNEEKANIDMEYIEHYMYYVINNGFELLTVDDLPYNSDIIWTIIDGDCELHDNHLYKTETSLERQPIKLKAVVAHGDIEREHVFGNFVLIDEYVGYIIAYFGGDDSSEKIHLGYSYDGMNWLPLFDGKAVLSAELGNGRIRDPYISRKKDGSFCMVATQGWNTPEIYLWDSQDLVSFYDERLCEVTLSGKLGLSGNRAWAPEFSYDMSEDQYVIYWSDPDANDGNGCIYANTSDDLKSFLNLLFCLMPITGL